jgi:hypothetical protein
MFVRGCKAVRYTRLCSPADDRSTVASPLLVSSDVLHPQAIEADCADDDALTALEAQRQRERLGRTGVAHAFKPPDVCGGGKRLDECETAIPMV